MLSFHNDPAVKAKYLARVEGHMVADNLVKGATGNGGKGCAVWCTLDTYDHARYPVELGIPEWLARVEDTLFEGMSLDKSRTWPRDFLSAIHIGADLEKAKAPFLIEVLRTNLETLDGLVVDATETAVISAIQQSRAAVQGCIDLWSRSDLNSEDWESAESAARSAWSAAESAARSAARSAESAARSAWSAAYDRFADKLLGILANISPEHA